MPENKIYIGIDIGGTKTSVCAGDSKANIIGKKVFPTHKCFHTALKNIFNETENLIAKFGKETIQAVGISCGGPLDSEKGIIQSPPNLPGWDNVPITKMLEDKFSLPCFIENDANACALAEWNYGAGFDKEKGMRCRNMVFFTFGTGLGAGLILDGKLYRGSSGMAGEAGHIRMTKDGPLGYGKSGSLEGWCSGGGISRAYFDLYGENISGGEVCIRAERGDKKALKVIDNSAIMLGRFLAALIDFINPDRIVIGSIFSRSEKLFRSRIEGIISEECLPASAAVCSIYPSALGESLGDIAALTVAVSGEQTAPNCAVPP
ncbi:MAG: ROK family protein [Treponema sp.]|jgi:glucokinase|nr:ROK family protein [Treponema sp.]